LEGGLGKVAATPLDILEDHEHTLWVDIELDIVMDIGLDVAWPYTATSEGYRN